MTQAVASLCFEAPGMPGRRAPDLTVRLLSGTDDVSSFDCGTERWARPVAAFLTEDALDQQRRRLSKTYLFLEDASIAGYVCVLTGGIHTASKRNMPDIGRDYAPLAQIGQLGVASRFQRRGIARTILLYFDLYGP